MCVIVSECRLKIRSEEGWAVQERRRVKAEKQDEEQDISVILALTLGLGEVTTCP